MMGISRREAEQRLLHTARRAGSSHAQLGVARLSEGHGRDYLSQRISLLAGVGQLRRRQLDAWGGEIAAAYEAGYREVRP